MWGNEETWGNLQVDLARYLNTPEFWKCSEKVEISDFFRFFQKNQRKRQIVTLGGVYWRKYIEENLNYYLN